VLLALVRAEAADQAIPDSMISTGITATGTIPIGCEFYFRCLISIAISQSSQIDVESLFIFFKEIMDSELRCIDNR
jgi:hypothetical protein